MIRSGNSLFILLIYLVLAVTTIIAYEPLRHNEFVDYDDYHYITENPYVKAGITYKSVVWAFTTIHSANWHPLTWLSHMLDYELFGLNPLWHHLTNLLFHIANTLLLFWILKRATGAVWRSGFVAAAFALHPLHVESVAWAAERKDVLSSLFWMLTIAAYVWYTERRGIKRYLLIVLFFSSGLLAKPMLVTLPFVLLLLDYWPLGRFSFSRQPKLGNTDGAGFPVARLIAEKIPLFVLAATSSVVTYIVQQSWGAMGRLPLNFRIVNALISYVRYIGKVIYPNHLAVLYPYSYGSSLIWQLITSLLVLAVVSAGIIYTARRRGYLIAGWLWYLGTLVPVIGLVQVGEQAMADRYTYLPSIGIFIMISWGVAELAVRWRYRRIGLGILAGTVLVILLICARLQVGHWRNSFTLFEHTLAATKNNCVIHNNYGNTLQKGGQLDKAVWHIKEALRIKPQYYEAHNNLGNLYFMQGKIKQAFACWNKVLKIKPDCQTAINNLAWAKATQESPDFRNPEEAVQLALRACELTGYSRPGFLDTLAASYAAAGNFPKAIETAQRALELAESLQQKKLAGRIQNRLRLYRANQPYIKSLPKASSD